MDTELGKLMVRLTGDSTHFVKSVNDAIGGTDRAGRSMKKASDEAVVFGKVIDNLGTKMSSMAGQFRAMVALESPWGFIKEGVQIAMNMERMRTDFGVMLQSAEAGTRLIRDLQKFAAETPLTMKGLTSASKILLQFGVESEKLIPTLKQLGDVIGGDEQKLQSMALAFGQMSSTGRLMGGDLMQMINVGFNPLQEISRTTGRSMVDLKKDMENGKITLDMVKGALVSATSEGGKFKNGMLESSKTLSGLVSTMTDDIDMLKQTIGETIVEQFRLKDAVKLVSSVAQSATETFNDLNPVMKTVTAATIALTMALGMLAISWKVGAIAVGMAIGVLKDVVISIRAVTAATWAWILALRTKEVVVQRGMMGEALMTKTNWSAVGAAIALKAAILTGIVAAVGYMIHRLAGGKEAMDAFNDAMERGVKLNDQMAQARSKYNQQILDKGKMLPEGPERTKYFENEVAMAAKELESINAQVEAAKKRVKDMDTTGHTIARNIPLAGRGLSAELEAAKKDAAEAEARQEQARKRLNDARDAEKEAKAAQAAAASALLQSQIDSIGMAFAEGAEKAAKAAKDLKDDVDRLTKSLNESVATFGMSAHEADIYKLKLRGASEAELAAAENANFLLEQLEANKRMVEAGADITKEYATPLEKYTARMEELQTHLDAGTISQDTFNRASAAAQKQLDESTESVKKMKEELMGLDAVLSGGSEAKARIAAFKTINDEQYTPRNVGNANPTSTAQGNATLGQILNVMQRMHDLAKIEAAKEAVQIELTDLNPFG